MLIYYEFTFTMVTGTDILAPESRPTTTSVVYSELLEPNSVLTVVAVILIVVPITVLLTFVPIVVVEFKDVASGVLIPTPLNELIVLTSPIVAIYTDCSKVDVAPK
jgi:hypothetical protein